MGQIYKAMADRHHWTAREVDELELWEVATYLGIGSEPNDPQAEFMARARQKMATGEDPLLQSSAETAK